MGEGAEGHRPEAGEGASVATVPSPSPGARDARATLSREGRGEGAAHDNENGKKRAGEKTATIARARALRREMTDAERVMWRLLRDRRLAGAKFRRQVPLGPYVADFLSFDRHLIVEVDGGQHAGSVRDQKRDAWFAESGFRTLRFWNSDVLGNADGVFLRIQEAVQ